MVAGGGISTRGPCAGRAKMAINEESHIRVLPISER